RAEPFPTDGAGTPGANRAHAQPRLARMAMELRLLPGRSRDKNGVFFANGRVLMRPDTRKKAISGHGVRGTRGKARARTKVKKLSGTRPKAAPPRRAAALGPGFKPQSPASAGQKPGENPR